MKLFWLALAFVSIAFVSIVIANDGDIDGCFVNMCPPPAESATLHVMDTTADTLTQKERRAINQYIRTHQCNIGCKLALMYANDVFRFIKYLEDNKKHRPK